jgi:hypothetical protein
MAGSFIRMRAETLSYRWSESSKRQLLGTLGSLAPQLSPPCAQVSGFCKNHGKRQNMKHSLENLDILTFLTSLQESCCLVGVCVRKVAPASLGAGYKPHLILVNSGWRNHDRVQIIGLTNVRLTLGLPLAGSSPSQWLSSYLPMSVPEP